MVLKIKGKFKYLYRAVDKVGDTVDILLTAKKDIQAAKSYQKKAIRKNGIPLKIYIDGNRANAKAIRDYNGET